MPKLPFMRLYTGDWYSGTKTMDHRHKGYYIDLLCLIWEKGRIGKLRISPRELANLWNIPNAYEDVNTTDGWHEQIQNILIAFENSFTLSFTEVTNNDGGLLCYEITQNRIRKDQKDLIDNAKRQKRFYDRSNGKHNTTPNANLTHKKLDVRSHINTTPIVPKGDGEFDQFWKAYPRKVGKGAAEKSWKNHKPPIVQVLEAIGQQSKSDQWQRDRGQFIPHPATWLNQRRWEDEVVIASSANRPIDPAKLETKTEELRRLAERDYARRMRKGDVKPGQEPPWEAPFELPALKLAKDIL